MVAGEDKKTHISVVELYGFFSWNLSAIVFVIYMVWAFVPNEVLNEFGIYYIPDKYYAIAIPLWLAVTLFTVLQLYVTVCIYATPSLDSYETLQDKHTILKNPNIEQESTENPALIKDGSKTAEGTGTNLASTQPQRPRNNTVVGPRTNGRVANLPGAQNILSKSQSLQAQSQRYAQMPGNNRSNKAEGAVGNNLNSNARP